ncbi:hypothetical protein I547_0548 [Mycobacterium kansasii 824]|uniref:Uncharacterized protein n=1 Tax=Mycobacterium kansasii TaxID=1768 RepID=A0A1V3XXA1_MYCKA|nr:hypothetical protein I547_0548 [Mycobacterium kansasii 824]KEP43307.1 hypothetical protein MKSMC1_16940 [Mycobacterium kansasii]OOK81856.1 hypothetical protein BZL30_0990 [Mycobacterium kansasii]OOK83824.1 hypothetical protein BZL29_0916 [Mycobacterium kansasii]
MLRRYRRARSGESEIHSYATSKSCRREIESAPDVAVRRFSEEEGICIVMMQHC